MDRPEKEGGLNNYAEPILALIGNSKNGEHFSYVPFFLSGSLCCWYALVREERQHFSWVLIFWYSG